VSDVKLASLRDQSAAAAQCKNGLYANCAGLPARRHFPKVNKQDGVVDEICGE